MIRLALGCIALIALGGFSPVPLWGAASAAQEQASRPDRSEGEPPEDEPTEPPRAEEAEEQPSLPRYVLPELPPAKLQHDGERFLIRPIFAILPDYTFIDQDEESLSQVGEQKDSRDLRAGRVGLIVRSKRGRGWEATFIADYQEPRTRDGQVFRVYDARFRLPVGPFRLDIGKQKQPFCYEVVGLSLLNPQQERILSPFFVTRSIGVTASGQLAGDRMTWAAGWYNDWVESNAGFADTGNDYVGRITGLVSAAPDNHSYLHVGLGLRRVGPNAGIVRLSGRPESNVAGRYVDTGEFEARHVGEVGLELAWGRGPLMMVAEHIESQTNASESGDPRFSGSYLMLSWVVTGESRPYNRAAGSTGALVPKSRYGAVELVTRYSHLDLTDARIEGGVLGKWYYGLNWWISRQWKAGISYGSANLNRYGVVGNTRLFLMRMQWFY